MFPFWFSINNIRSISRGLRPHFLQAFASPTAILLTKA